VPSEGTRTQASRLSDLPVVAVGASALAWTGIWLGTAAGGSQLYASSMSVGVTVGSATMFLGAWEVMVIAMMLPSSLGFLALFRIVTRGRPLRSVQRIGVCLGYALAWAAMGCVAMLVSVTLYRGGSIDAWLQSHSNLLAGGVLTLAGGFQLTSLKQRCLAVCSQPTSFLMRHYRRGVSSAVTLGLRFGLVCVSCCWALMAVTVVLGGGSLVFMLLLTVIMFAERVMGWDDRFVKAVGLAGIALGAFVAASPDAIPALAHNASGWIEMNSTMQMPSHGLLTWCHA
jgi:predicted metal-binding membrane protein